MTYCDGKNNECTSPMIVTVANVSLPAPGVVKHEYTDAPLMPQVIIIGVFPSSFGLTFNLNCRLKDGGFSLGPTKATTCSCCGAVNYRSWTIMEGLFYLVKEAIKICLKRH